MEDLIKKQKRTLVLVSHNIRQVERLCDRVVLLDKGTIVKDGAPRDVCNRFYEMNNDTVLGRMRSEALLGHSNVVSTGEIDVLGCDLFRHDSTVPVEQIAVHDSLVVAVTFQARTDLDDVDVVVGFHTSDLIYIATANTGVLPVQCRFVRGRHTVKCQFLDVALMPGVYGVRVGFLDRNARQMWYAENYRTLKVFAPRISVARASTVSMVDLRVDWSFTQEGCTTNAAARSA